MLIPTGEQLPMLLPASTPHIELLGLQGLTWAFLVASAWSTTQRGDLSQANRWMMLAGIGWMGTLLLTLPPGMIPYELMAVPRELGGVLGSMLKLSTTALMVALTFGELLVGNWIFSTVD
jgi:hypothetical protein